MSEGKSTVIQRSMGWSLFSEIAAKLVTPLTNMLLARILTPDDFGILAVCNMLVSFVDIITDAGFAKYLVQTDIQSDEERDQLANVAFWSNLALSVFLYLVIILNRVSIATLLGGKDYSTVICVASFQLILTSFSSIQTGLLRRKFSFKKLFIARLAVAVMPLLVAVPIAYFTKSYWALIAGTLAGALANTVILFIVSSWRPRFFYSFPLFKRMFSFSFWSLCEGLANWTIFWFDTFLVTRVYSSYYLGIYKNSSSMVLSIMGMITASMSPVLLSVLSRVKDSAGEFERVYLTIQRIMLYLVIPMGLGLFCYRSIATYILFGSQWDEAANVVGSWGLMMMCSIIFYSFPAELYKSRGIPKILFFFQCGYLIVLIPVCLAVVKTGFYPFVYIRCLCVVEQIILSLILCRKYFSITPGKLFANMVKPFACSCTIIVTSAVFSLFMHTRGEQFIAMLISAVLYFAVVYIFCRKDLLAAKDTIQGVSL